ncbi:hypothetical protein MtrunA17_Chr1g0197681 [Medicago truncatula]|uniref:Uncharacterized protein n=1 Tax=Medicago truncatula TaxID=3880 RepID=A0A396K530_MEDTR|nr:hypothetical protein MtrunA17_Chr1g0197681 [Medicago truncatula]
MEAVRLQADDFNDLFFKSAVSLSHVELSKWCCCRAITCNHGNFVMCMAIFFKSNLLDSNPK